MSTSFVTCPECEGKKFVDPFPYYVTSGKVERCSTCNGEGEIEEEDEEEDCD